MTKPLAAVSWSGGKDSCLAFHRTRERFDVRALITMFTEDGARSRSHGLRPEVIRRQAELLGVESVMGRCSWEGYRQEFLRVLATLRGQAITDVIFGDILFAEHKEWVEKVCAEAGLAAHEPLWGESTASLFREFLSLGGRARIVVVQVSRLDASWLGRPLDQAMLAELERLGVDACGENGEYHTLVTWAPAFSAPLQGREAGRVLRDGCWALDLTLEA